MLEPGMPLNWVLLIVITVRVLEGVFILTTYNNPKIPRLQKLGLKLAHTRKKFWKLLLGFGAWVVVGLPFVLGAATDILMLILLFGFVVNLIIDIVLYTTNLEPSSIEKQVNFFE
jgi:hypothetical protein